MIKTNDLNKDFWGEAVNTANQIRNYSPTKTKQKSPEEEFTGITPNLNKLKIFGCKVMVKNKKGESKLDDKAREGLMLGYNETNKTFRIWDLKRRKAILTRDVKIFEKTKPNQQEQNQEESSDEESEERIRSEDESEESDSYESDEEIDSDESKESEEEVEKQNESENREEKVQ